jgi:hypothetical protein
MPSPKEPRVDAIYEILTGRKPRRGEWDIAKRNFAQKIVHVEEACKSILEAIADLEKAKGDPLKVEETVRALRTEFGFLETLQE